MVVLKALNILDSDLDLYAIWSINADSKSEGESYAPVNKDGTLFSFTPEFDSTYLIYVTQEANTTVVVYDSNFNVLETSLSGDAASLYLTQSETYYIECVVDENAEYYSYDSVLHIHASYKDLIENNLQGSVYIGENSIQDVSGEILVYEFTATESGNYQFYSECEMDTYGYAYRDDGVIIDKDDDGYVNNQFLLDVYLEEGETYYIGVRLYNTSSTDSYPCTLHVESNNKA